LTPTFARPADAGTTLGAAVPLRVLVCRESAWGAVPFEAFICRAFGFTADKGLERNSRIQRRGGSHLAQ